MSEEVDDIYTLINRARYWKEFIPSKLEPLDDEELLLLSEKFYVAIEECNEDLKALDSDLHEALSNEVRKLEQRVAAVDGYYIERENKEKIMSKKIDNIYDLIDKSGLRDEYITSQLETLNQGELLLLQGRFQRQLEVEDFALTQMEVSNAEFRCRRKNYNRLDQTIKLIADQHLQLYDEEKE